MTAIAESTVLVKDLTLSDSYGYRIQDDRVSINIDQIASQRGLDNLSGTLAIELRGYQSNGQQTLLASTTIGQLAGQHYLSNCQYDLVFLAPDAGHWQIALELREWNGEGYELRDQKSFDQAYVVEHKDKVLEAMADKESNVILADFSPSPAQEASSQTKPAVKDKPSSKAEKVLLSVNHSSLEELSSVKGLPKKVAKEIVDKRPHSTWEGLLKLKGIGPKLLKKLSKVLKLN